MFHLTPPCAGLDEEGLYRKPGVLSKATKLVKECIEKGKTHSMNMTDEFEWDTKTLASAVKMYLNKQLGEPLFTFVMHHQFIDAASELILASALCIWQCQSLCGNDGVPRDRSLAPLCVWQWHTIPYWATTSKLKLPLCTVFPVAIALLMHTCTSLWVPLHPTPSRDPGPREEGVCYSRTMWPTATPSQKTNGYHHVAPSSVWKHMQL